MLYTIKYSPFADVAQSVEHLIGNEEVRRFKSARQLQKKTPHYVGVFFWRSHKNGLEWFDRRCRWQKSAEGAAGGKPSLPSADKHGNKSARQLHVAVDSASHNPLGKPSGFSNRSITSPHFARKHACWPVPCGYKRAHNGSRCAAAFAGPLKKHSFVLLRKYEGCFVRRKYKKRAAAETRTATRSSGEERRGASHKKRDPVSCA